MILSIGIQVIKCSNVNKDDLTIYFETFYGAIIN
jgi:hypothetical protein